MASETLRIDFSGVDKEIRSGGRAAHIPEGDYLFKVVSHELRKSERSGSRYISWQVQCMSKPYAGKTIYHITSLKHEALWNLRNLIFACTGKNFGGKVANFAPRTIYGKVFAGTTEDDTYIKNEGNENEREVMRSILADIRPKAELKGSDEDEDEDTEDEEEYEDEEAEDEDEDEDEDEVPPPKKRPRAKAKTSSKRRTRDDDEEDEDLEDVDVDDI
jgi:hypothetical protein